MLRVVDHPRLGTILALVIGALSRAATDIWTYVFVGFALLILIVTTAQWGARRLKDMASKRKKKFQNVPNLPAPVQPAPIDTLLDRLQQAASGMKVKIKNSNFSSKKTGMRVRGKVDLDMEDTDVQGDETAFDAEGPTP